MNATDDGNTAIADNQEVKDDHGLVNKKFKCIKCGFCYTTEQLLNEHNLNEHSMERKRFSCTSCSVTCHSKKIMLLHKQNIHPDKCHKCHICNQTFFTARKLGMN